MAEIRFCNARRPGVNRYGAPSGSYCDCLNLWCLDFLERGNSAIGGWFHCLADVHIPHSHCLSFAPGVLRERLKRHGAGLTRESLHFVQVEQNLEIVVIMTGFGTQKLDIAQVLICAFKRPVLNLDLHLFAVWAGVLNEGYGVCQVPPGF